MYISWIKLKEYSGLLIGRHLSVVATSHVATHDGDLEN